MTEQLVAENELENKLVKADRKEIEFGEFLDLFLISDVFVPSASEVMPDGSGMEPLLFNKQNVRMLGVFTAISKVSLFKDNVPFCLTMKVIDLLARLPPDSGLVVNPGYDIGFDLSPDGIQSILNDDA